MEGLIGVRVLIEKEHCGLRNHFRW